MSLLKLWMGSLNPDPYPCIGIKGLIGFIQVSFLKKLYINLVFILQISYNMFAFNKMEGMLSWKGIKGMRVFLYFISFFICM